jgi:hypothetical protein
MAALALLLLAAVGVAVRAAPILAISGSPDAATLSTLATEAATAKPPSWSDLLAVGLFGTRPDSAIEAGLDGSRGSGLYLVELDMRHTSIHDAFTGMAYLVLGPKGTGRVALVDARTGRFILSSQVIGP